MFSITKTTTEPTPFILTERASHVIAAFVPLDFGLAHRTELDGLLLTKLVHQGLFARSPSTMPVVSAFKTHSILAFRTNQLASLQILPTHHSFTTFSRAIANKRVAFLLDFFLEHVQFCDHFRAPFKDTKYLLLCSFARASLLDAN